jgi:hypothetical protein
MRCALTVLLLGTVMGFSACTSSVITARSTDAGSDVADGDTTLGDDTAVPDVLDVFDVHLDCARCI